MSGFVIRANETEVEIGGALTGVVELQSGNEFLRKAKRASLFTRARVVTKEGHIELVHGCEVLLHQGEPIPTPLRVHFTAPVPDRGPCSYAGSLVNVTWEAIVSLDNRLEPLPETVVHFKVLPKGTRPSPG